MRSPVAKTLADMMRPVLKRTSDLQEIDLLSAAEAAAIILEQADVVSMGLSGAPCSAGLLREMATKAENIAAEYRRIAARREREAS